MPLVYIACVGSRETPPDILAWMEVVGAELVRGGYSIVSGNAAGADQAWARGANKVDPSKVLLLLSWAPYERAAIAHGNVAMALENHADRVRWMDLAAALHPAWDRLDANSRRMHARNVGIVESARMVLGYVNALKPGGGGTGMAFRAARHLKIPARDVANATVRASVLDEVSRILSNGGAA